MKILSKKTEGATITLEAIASKSEVEKAFAAAHMDFAQRMSLKPDSNLTIGQAAEKYLGLTDLDAAVESRVVEHLIPFAVDTLGIAPAYPARALESSPVHPGSEITFTCEVVLKTDLELSSYEPVTIHVPSFMLVDDQIDRQIKDMANSYAEYEGIPPRPAQAEDACLLNIQAQENFTDIPELSSEKAIYILGSNLISAEFDEHVVGMNVDECKEFTLEIASSDESGMSRTVDFIVELLEVREKHVPVIDDAWIGENIPGVSSLEEFRDLLRKELTKSYQPEYEEMLRQEAASELAKRYTGGISDEAIAAMQQTIIGNIQDKMRQKGSNLDAYINENGGEEQFNISILEQSKEILAQGYALDALFLHEKMVLTDEDIFESCKTFDPEHPDMIRKQMEFTGYGYMLRETAERFKASQWLVDNAELLLPEAS